MGPGEKPGPERREGSNRSLEGRSRDRPLSLVSLAQGLRLLATQRFWVKLTAAPPRAVHAARGGGRCARPRLSQRSRKHRSIVGVLLPTATHTLCASWHTGPNIAPEGRWCQGEYVWGIEHHLSGRTDLVRRWLQHHPHPRRRHQETMLRVEAFHDQPSLPRAARPMVRRRLDQPEALLRPGYRHCLRQDLRQPGNAGARRPRRNRRPHRQNSE